VENAPEGGREHSKSGKLREGHSARGMSAVGLATQPAGFAWPRRQGGSNPLQFAL